MAFLRVQRGIVRGKKFTTRKRAAEYVFRNWQGGFVNGQKPSNFDQRSVSKPTAHDPRKVTKGAASDCIRVRPINGLWRRYVQSGEAWRFVSDHSTMADALSGTNPVGVEPQFDRSNEHVQSDASFD